MMSNISDEFKRIVDDGNVKAVRVALRNYLLIGAIDVFDESLAYARDRVPGLVQPHNGGSFTDDKSKWDIDYLAGLYVDMVDNFSDDRIRHAKSVVNEHRRVAEETVIDNDARSHSVRSAPHSNRRVVGETVIDNDARSRSVRSAPHSNRRVVEETIIEDDVRSRNVRSDPHSNRRVVKETVIEDNVRNQSVSSSQSMKICGNRRSDVYAFMKKAACFVAGVCVMKTLIDSILEENI